MTSNDWTPYTPGIFSFFAARAIVRQIGYRPIGYVMRKRDNGRWIYRPCTHAESSDLEARDGERIA